MNPYERRIIHAAVQGVEGAKSWSEGEDLNRHYYWTRRRRAYFS